MPGSETLIASSFINTALTGDTALMAAAPGGVWSGSARDGTPYPLVRFDAQSPGVVVRGVGTTEVMMNQLWLVRGIVEASSYATLQVIVERIQAKLHGVTDHVVGSGMIVASLREDAFDQEVVQGGREYRHLGGIYRMYVQG